MSSVPPTALTAEQIQRYLDENKQLILAILDNQNLGRLNECAMYQAQLQKNLLYLAAIADAQPSSTATAPQMMPSQGSPVPPQISNQYMQQQNFNMAPRSPIQFSPQQAQPHMMMQFQGQMGMRPPLMHGNTMMNGMHASINAQSPLASDAAANTNNSSKDGQKNSSANDVLQPAAKDN